MPWWAPSRSQVVEGLVAWDTDRAQPPATSRRLTSTTVRAAGLWFNSRLMSQPEAPPRRVRFDRNELSGAFGDLGTDFPLVVGMVLAAGLDVTSVLVMFGLMQVLTGLAYGLPMPVQPLAALTSLTPVAAETPPPVPLPGNLTCAYPAGAQRAAVAGPVLFVAQVRPDGSVKSVGIRQVPAKGLGFEEAVRACVSKWRFEPAARNGGLRQYEGKIHYRIATPDEVAVRALLEAFASAWNANNAEAIGALAGVEQHREAAGTGSTLSLPEQFATDRAAADWNMDLEPAFQHVQFLRSDVAVVRQPFYKERPTGAGGPVRRQSSLLEATARKRGDSWSLLAWYPLAGPPSTGRWLFPGIEEPRKVKHVDPIYPNLALKAPVSAIVTLEAEVDASGHVAAVRILRGGRPFDDAAMLAVKQWEYAPTLLEGVPIPIVIRVEVPFNLEARCPTCVGLVPAVH
jgi:TonB family protein